MKKVIESILSLLILLVPVALTWTILEFNWAMTYKADAIILLWIAFLLYALKAGDSGQ